MDGLSLPEEYRNGLHLSRRRILQLGGAAAVLAAGSQLVGPAAADAVDSYDSLRGVWLQLLTGSGFDPAAQPFADALTTLGSTASGFQGTMAPAASSLWPDLPIGTVSANVTSSFSRLKTMALAYVQPNTGLTGNVSLASAVTSGLDWLNSKAYTATTASYDNWWDWQIGAPQALLDTATLVYGRLTAAQIANYCAAVDHFVPASLVSSYTGNSTGANRVDLCRVLGLRGVIGKNSSSLTAAQTGLSPVLPYVTSGDGIYADGSFIQHKTIPYTGTYGQVLLDGLARMITLLAGSSWAVTDPNLQQLFTAVTSCYAPMIYNGLVFDGQSGRAISRFGKDDHTRGHALLEDVLLLALSGAPSASQSASWKAMVKGWMQRDTTLPYLSDPTMSIPSLARAQTLLSDPAVSPSPEPLLSKVFSMDRATHRRAGWAAQLSICSSRTSFYETGNGENLRGFHSNSGMLYWFGDTFGNDQYSDSFWPTVDPYKLPGTTVSTKALADAAGGTWGAAKPNTAWAGGASDGENSVVGQDVRGVLSTLVGKKSWFFLDDSVVCLGAGISCTDGTRVQTTVDNRKLGVGSAPAFTVDGAVQPSTSGWSQAFTNCRSMAIEGMGGWVFPGGANVSAQRTTRTGAWSDINTGGPTDQISRDYMSMWFDHGTNPSGAGYAYQLLPGADAATAAARAANPDFTVLANTATVQAISCPALGLTMANFYAAGTAGPITASGPCSVLIKEQSGTMTTAIADPSRAANSVQVTVARPGYTGVVATSGIDILLGTDQVVFLARVGGSLGASMTASLNATGATPQLGATATSYVRDGSFAGTNFGNTTTMVDKNTNALNTGYNRKSFLKFDVSGVTGTVGRAVLWVNGYVSDSGGTQTTLQAYATDSASWTESAVTWNTAPGLTTPLGTGTAGATPGWIALDVTSAVAAAVGGAGIASLALWEPSGAVGLAVILNTRLNSTNPPRLVVSTQ